MERLRHVARSSDGADEGLVRQAAAALAACAEDPPGLLTACRRIVARIPDSAPIVQLCARMVVAPDPVAEAREVVRRDLDDPTFAELAGALPAEATVVLVAASPSVARPLVSRGDVEVLVVDNGRSRVFTTLLDHDVDAIDVPPGGIGPAVSHADLVVVEAVAWGPDRWLAPRTGHAVAATARSVDVPVWVTVGEGRVLPARMFDPMAERAVPHDPWYADVEVVPAGLVDVVVGPSGAAEPRTVIGRADCPVAPEIFGGLV